MYRPLAARRSLRATMSLSLPCGSWKGLHTSIRSGSRLTTIPLSMSCSTVSNSTFISRQFNSSATLSSTLSSIQPTDTFVRRHIGPTDEDISDMCKTIGVKDLDQLVSMTVPDNIRIKKATNLGPGLSESETIDRLKFIASKNKILKSYIGMGYASSITPPVILRNIMENPAWYTQVSF